MGVIRFTQKDLDRSKPFEAGWRPVKITAIVEKLSKKKDSINNVLTVDVDVDGDTRSIEHTINEKANFSAQPLIEAVTKGPVEAGVDYDLAAFVGVELFAEFSKEIYKDANNPNDRGRPINKIIGWASKDNPPF